MSIGFTRFFISVFFVLLSYPLVFAKPPIRTVQGVVVKVADGDSITVKSDGTKLKVRLYGIDAPEIEKLNRKTSVVAKQGQLYGEEALRALEGKVLHKQVRLDIIDIDKYRRSVAIVTLDDRNINFEMVTEGWAWAYRKYLDRPYASEFIEAEEQARRQRLGLWQQNNPQPPWELRKTQK